MDVVQILKFHILHKAQISKISNYEKSKILRIFLNSDMNSALKIESIPPFTARRNFFLEA